MNRARRATRRNARLAAAALPLLAVVVALGAGALILLADGHSPLEAGRAVWDGALSGRAAFGTTLEKATPLVLAGLAVIVGLRAGLFNIGAQGQLLAGSIAAAWVGYRVSGLPGTLHVALCLVAGMVAGALPAALAGVLKATRGVHEVIVTIMTNTIVINLTDWLAGGPWMEPGQAISRTPPIAASARIGRLGPLPLGFVGAVLMAAAVCFVLGRTTLGFRLATVGANRHAAAYAGISLRRVTVSTMALSGALAGLGGAVETLAVVGRFEPGFNRGLGFDGITIALLAGASAWAAIPAALLIGALRAASTQLQSTARVAPEIVDVVLAIALLLVAAPTILRWVLRRRSDAGADQPRLSSGWGS